MLNACLRRLVPVVAACLLAVSYEPQSVWPQTTSSVRFAVIGDSGTGEAPQYDLAARMAATRGRLPFEFVIMLGDNLYGGRTQQGIIDKFERPYKPLLEAGVQFYASLGNHDDAQERSYAAFHMRGERYYTFTRSQVDFFALDSNYMDQPQLAWLEQALRASSARWKIAFFHHPLYSSAGRHGSETDLRLLLEPLFIRYGVNVVFSGHDHVYERVRPQHGITYFVCGSSGQLRRGNLDRKSGLMAAGFDQDRIFMVIDIEDEILQFQAISRTDGTVDSGQIALPSPGVVARPGTMPPGGGPGRPNALVRPFGRGRALLWR